MAEHRVKKNNIIYIIPDDELYEKLKKDEAFIDDYGRLVNRKPHRILRELKHYVATAPMVQRKPISPPAAPIKKNSPGMDYIKEAVRVKTAEKIKEKADYAIDKLFDEVGPKLWHEHVVPFYHRVKDSFASKELKVDAVLPKERTDVAVVEPKTGTKMTKEEADTEKRKVLYHWLSMLSSLKKLHEADEVDADITLSRLTDPEMLERINGYLSENPNLLETDKYISLQSLLGRNLYEEKLLVPIRADEITTIAASCGYEERTKEMEDNHNG